jgi:hypothetical protein
MHTLPSATLRSVVVLYGIWEQGAEEDIWTGDGWNGTKFKNAE